MAVAARLLRAKSRPANELYGRAWHFCIGPPEYAVQILGRALRTLCEARYDDGVLPIACRIGGGVPQLSIWPRSLMAAGAFSFCGG
jgi:hypothetical protein